MLVNRKSEEDFIPHGDYVYTAGHRLFVIARSRTEIEIENIFGKTESNSREESKAGQSTGAGKRHEQKSEQLPSGEKP
jgi:hypothetical protein